ncbi:unnamed protein product [Notodromas monacha]|uniref:Uncharacterized protein n=1 Tax=Notodromas monacha TaxID=399045 RepID=A0A7R9C1N5_9CRUS|nr:unnamed protein product [Notodromas monacha]CAG0925284.1 unnamed protein product [Notodromas monacha]
MFAPPQPTAVFRAPGKVPLESNLAAPSGPVPCLFSAPGKQVSEAQQQWCWLDSPAHQQHQQQAPPLPPPPQLSQHQQMAQGAPRFPSTCCTCSGPQYFYSQGPAQMPAPYSVIRLSHDCDDDEEGINGSDPSSRHDIHELDKD